MQTERVDVPRSSELAARLVVVDETGSTNDELVRSAMEDPAAWPDFSVLLTDRQTAGRGRLGRAWVTRPGESLAVSVLLRPEAGPEGVPLERYGWLPLAAGLAMARALRSLVAGHVGVKWPNDVLIEGGKVCGILSELLPDGRGVVIGAGVNLGMEAAHLPTDWSTSLLVAGASDVGADAVLAPYLGELRELSRQLAGAGDASVRRVRDAVSAVCDTLGRQVRIELPSGEVLTGRAEAIDETGRLVVRGKAGASALAAGDVTHLRY